MSPVPEAMSVPAPYTAVAASHHDLEALWRCLVAIDIAEAGTPTFGFDEFENWVTGDPIVLADDVMTVRDEAGAIVGLEIFSSRQPFVRPFVIGGVHPEHVGRGLGAVLLQWGLGRATRQIAKAPAAAKVTIVSYSAAGHEGSEHLMRAAGLEFARYFVDMEIEFDGQPAKPVVPSGVTIRVFDPEADVAATADAITGGFRDHYGFVDSSVAERIAQLKHWMTAAHFDPSLWWLAEDGGEIVGANLCEDSNAGDASVGYVASLSVLRNHRSRGLGRAFLLTAFNEFHRRGKKGAALGVDVDSLTDATRLYESVGMSPGIKYASWEMEIRPGLELATVRAPS